VMFGAHFPLDVVAGDSARHGQRVLIALAFQRLTREPSWPTRRSCPRSPASPP
jgi:hypothetical protein